MGAGERLRRGFRTFLATPRLRGLAALNVVAALGTAMVTVNTVVLVRARLGYDDRATAIGLATFGLGAIVATFLLRPLLGRFGARPLMFAGAGLVSGSLLVGTIVPGLRILLPLWFGIGIGCTLAQTPYGLLIRRTIVSREDKPPLYAAQFALAHLALLVAYPLAGWLGSRIGLSVTFLVLGLAAILATLAAAALWRSEPEDEDESEDRSRAGA